MAVQQQIIASVAAPPVYELRAKTPQTVTANNGPVQPSEPPSYTEVVFVSRPVAVHQLERETSSHPSHEPRDYRKWCYASLLLFAPSGIIALVCSLNARNRRLTGRYDEAELWSKRTFISNMVSTVIGILALLLAFSVIIVKVLSADNTHLEKHLTQWSATAPNEPSVTRASSERTEQRTAKTATPFFRRGTDATATATPFFRRGTYATAMRTPKSATTFWNRHLAQSTSVRTGGVG